MQFEIYSRTKFNIKIANCCNFFVRCIQRDMVVDSSIYEKIQVLVSNFKINLFNNSFNVSSVSI